MGSKYSGLTAAQRAALKAVSGAGKTAVAAALVSAYESQQLENTQLGQYLESRGALAANDTPVITAQTTSPVNDATDPAPRISYLCGEAVTTTLTKAQKIAAKRWVRGHSVGAYCFGYAKAIRFSNSMAQYGVGGNQNLSPEDNWGYNANPICTEVSLDGDVLYWPSVPGNICTFLIGNKLLDDAGAASTNITYTASSHSYSAGGATSPGSCWIKLKFPTSAKRTIRIVTYAAGSLGDFYTRPTDTLLPASLTPIEWVHFGDSFSEVGPWGLSDFMASQFGRNVNFINVAQGGTAFNGGNDVGGTVVGTKANFRQQMQGHWRYCSPQIVTGLVGKNDDSQNQAQVLASATTMLGELKALFPNAIIVIFTANSGPYAITYANDLAVEATLLNAISLTSGIFAIPMQTGPTGPFLRGNGVAWAPAAGPLTLAANINNASAGTLSTAWTKPTGLYTVTFSVSTATVASGKDIRRCTLTNGSTAMTGLSSSITTSSTTCPDGRGNTDAYSGVSATETTDPLHPTVAGHKATGLWMAARLYEVLRAMF